MLALMDHHPTPGSVAHTMRDKFSLRSPFGIFGTNADFLFLTRYTRSYLLKRHQAVKATAEAEDWQEYLGTDQQIGGLLGLHREAVSPRQWDTGSIFVL